MQPVKGVITDIQRYSVHDGPGMRTTVFFKGCPLRCRWCCNPEAMLPGSALMVNPKLCIGCGACTTVCPVDAAKGPVTDRDKCIMCRRCEEVCYAGARYFKERELTSRELTQEILKDKIFFDRTGGGVTFSGGEAAVQIDFLEDVLIQCKANSIHTAIETCGICPWDHYERIFHFIDLFLFDIKSTDDDLHREYTGASCKGIMENCRKLIEKGARVIVRVPVIPQFNFNREALKKISSFAFEVGAEEVNFLPYHRYAQNKYDFLGMTYWNPGVTSLSHEEVQKMADTINEGIRIVVNG